VLSCRGLREQFGRRPVGIIDDGRLVAQGTPAALVASHGGSDRIRLSCGDEEPDRGAAPATAPATATVTAALCDASRRIPDVVRTAEAMGVARSGIEVHKPDLEGVFPALTGKELRA